MAGTPQGFPKESPEMAAIRAQRAYELVSQERAQGEPVADAELKRAEALPRAAGTPMSDAGDDLGFQADDLGFESDDLGFQADAPRASQADVRKAEKPELTLGTASWTQRMQALDNALKMLSKANFMGLGAWGAGKAVEGNEHLADLAGGKVTDTLAEHGVSPEKAAAFGYGTNVAVQLPLALAGGAKSIGNPIARRLDKVRDLAGLAKDNPARKEAVEQLSEHLQAADSDKVLTPGQVTGEAGFVESQARKASPRGFARQEKEVSDAATDMLDETVNPAGTMGREELGKQITGVADKVVKATKERLRPVWKEADELLMPDGTKGIKVDMAGVRDVAAKALRYGSGIGKKLDKQEVDMLSEIVDELTPGIKQLPDGTSRLVTDARATPEQVMDFMSRRKEQLRQVRADWVPSEYFNQVTGDLVKTAEKAYADAALQSGRGDIITKLKNARQDYGTMMDTVYEDAMKAALKKDPEKIGALFAAGNVSSIRQVHKLLALAENEGVHGVETSRKIRGDMVRGFLQRSVQDADSAASWSERLRSPEMRDTWNVLTGAGPEGKALRRAMEVMEEAGKMARRTVDTTGQPIAVNRAATESAGRRTMTGSQDPSLFLGLLSYTGLTKMLATAYTHANTGMINKITAVMKSAPVRTAAAQKFVTKAVPEIQQWANEHNIDLGEQ